MPRTIRINGKQLDQLIESKIKKMAEVKKSDKCGKCKSTLKECVSKKEAKCCKECTHSKIPTDKKPAEKKMPSNKRPTAK